MFLSVSPHFEPTIRAFGYKFMKTRIIIITNIMYLSYNFYSITKAVRASFKFTHVSIIPIREPDRIRTGETSLLQRPGLSHLPTDSMGSDRVELSEEPPHIYYSTVLQTAVRNKALVFS